jgi:ketosteroid isomerase-like protein
MVYFSASAPVRHHTTLQGLGAPPERTVEVLMLSSSRHLGEQVPRRCAGAHWMASWTVPAVGQTRVGKVEEHTPVSTQENKVLVCHFFEAFDEGDLDAIEEMLASDFVDHSPLPDQGRGREGYKLLLAEDRAALSDVRTTIEYQATDGDDMVIRRLTMRSTHHHRTGPHHHTVQPVGAAHHGERPEDANGQADPAYGVIGPPRSDQGAHHG